MLLAEAHEPFSIANAKEPHPFDITIGQGNRELLLHEGAMSVETPIKFGPDLEDVSIDALSSLEVELGCDSTYVNVVTPVSIACKSLLIHARHMSVVAGQHAYFRASEFVSNVQSPPRVHGDATLGVDWNWSEYPYPWTHYKAKASAPGGLDRDSEEILRRLRKFVVVCKAGLDGRLGRHAGKFENNRMFRGWGRSVLARLLERRVFQKDGQMYYLDPTRLSTVTGLTYDGCRKGEYTGASLEFAAEVGGEG